MNIIEINQVQAGYGKKIILKSIQLGVARKEVIGIIGPNGSGKTTLLRAVSRILKPGAGSILLEGKDIHQMKMKEFARKVAVVSQYIDPTGMTVEEYVLMGRVPYLKAFQFTESHQDRDIAMKYMGLTGITGLKDKQMEEISGGEKQLAQIARALVQEPEVLLLDEPTSHLDIKHQVEILDLVRKFNKDLGITIVMVLHDLNLAAEYCERLVLLSKGKTVKIGTPAEVLTYQLIEEVYETVVIVKSNPVSLKPYVFLVSEEEKKKNATALGNPVKIRS